MFHKDPVVAVHLFQQNFLLMLSDLGFSYLRVCHRCTLTDPVCPTDWISYYDNYSVLYLLMQFSPRFDVTN